MNVLKHESSFDVEHSLSRLSQAQSMISELTHVKTRQSLAHLQSAFLHGLQYISPFPIEPKAVYLAPRFDLAILERVNTLQDDTANLVMHDPERNIDWSYPSSSMNASRSVWLSSPSLFPEAMHLSRNFLIKTLICSASSIVALHSPLHRSTSYTEQLVDSEIASS